MAVDRERSPETQRNSSLRIRNSRKDGNKRQVLSGEMIGQINQLLVGKWANPDGTAMSGQPVPSTQIE